MSCSKEFVNYILEQCSDLTARPMMGEYVVYFKGKVIGGFYNNRFLIKAIPEVEALIPNAKKELPYDGAKLMILYELFEDQEFSLQVYQTLFDKLPDKKKK